MKVVMNCCDYLTDQQLPNNRSYYNNSPAVPQHYSSRNSFVGYENHYSNHFQQHYQLQQQNSMMSASVGVQAPVNYHNYYNQYHQQYSGYQPYYHHHYNNVHHQQAPHPQYMQPLPPANYSSGPPAYVYNPQEARLRKAQREQTKLALRAQRQRKSSLTPEEDCSPLPHLPQMQHLPPLLRHARHAATALAPSPHKVHHHHQQGTAATAAVSASVREQVMHGMVPPSPPHHASPPPRFYPSMYESETYHQNPQQHPQHHYPSPHQSTWYQYPHHQQNQNQNNSCNYGSVPSVRSMSHPGYAGYNGSATTYVSPQHQGMMLTGLPGEDEEDLTALSSRAVNQYEVEGTLPPVQQPPQQPRVEEAVTTEEQAPNNPDSQPLPPFQHAFGSTEIGRFAHEGFSAQVRTRPPNGLPSPMQGSPPGSLPWSPRGSATTQQFPLNY